MKKLLILALVANAATPVYAHNSVSVAVDSIRPSAIAYFIATAPYRLVKKAAKQIVKTGKAVGTELKDIGSEIGGQLVEVATVPVNIITDTAKAVKDSEFVQEASDVAGQFAAFPVQIGGDIKDGFNVTIDATRTVGRKIADSRFVAKVKDANQAIVDASKKAATKVKDVTNDIIHSEAVEDTKDVFGQFADAPRETWDNFAAFFTAIKSEFID